MIFQYLDQNHKEYISYGDFCRLSDEVRRHLDTAFDDSEIQR